MSKTKEELKAKIEKGIKRTGFPLEMEIGKILREKDWLTNHSYFYFDVNDLDYKELDIRAYKMNKYFITNLYIECKHSIKKQWIFFVPEKYSFVDVYDLKYFPLRKEIEYKGLRPLLKDSIFNVLKEFSDSTDIALNSSVFQGDKKTDDNSIRKAINSCIEALIVSNLEYFVLPPIPFKPSLNLACVVFDGYMFAYRQKGRSFSLRERKYIKYRHDYRIEPWKHPSYIRDIPIMKMCQRYRNAVRSSYILEFIHKDYFSSYIDKLDKSLEELNKIPEDKFKKKTQ